MSVYIKGMEMPKPGRYEAVIIVLDKYTAEIAISPAEDDIGYWKEYPLIPVPDHGDLIDRDETLKKLSPEQIKNVKPDMTWEEIYELNVLDIVTMPTIIPEDKEGEG